MDESTTSKRKADGEFVMKKVFDGSEPEPKVAKRDSSVPPPPPEPAADDDENAPAADPVEAPKKGADISILNFRDVTPDHLNVSLKQETTNKNKAKFNKVELKEKNQIIRSPRIFFNGFWSNDSGYTLKGAMLGVPGGRNKGDPIPPDPKYPNLPAEQLKEKGDAHDAALSLDEFFIQLLCANPHWYKFKPATDDAGRKRIEDHVRKNWRPIMESRQNEQTGERYAPQFYFTLAVGEDGKELFSIKDDSGKPIDVKTMLLTQGGDKKPMVSAFVGFTPRRITYPNSGPYRFGLQLIAHSVKILRGGSGGSFREELRDVALE